MPVIITIEVDDEFADDEHDTGLTEAGYIVLSKALGSVASGIVDIVKADE